MVERGATVYRAICGADKSQETFTAAPEYKGTLEFRYVFLRWPPEARFPAFWGIKYNKRLEFSELVRNTDNIYSGGWALAETPVERKRSWPWNWQSEPST